MEGVWVSSSASEGSAGDRMDWMRSGDVIVAVWVRGRPDADAGGRGPVEAVAAVAAVRERDEEPASRGGSPVGPAVARSTARAASVCQTVAVGAALIAEDGEGGSGPTAVARAEQGSRARKPFRVRDELFALLGCYERPQLMQVAAGCRSRTSRSRSPVHTAGARETSIVRFRACFCAALLRCGVVVARGRSLTIFRWYGPSQPRRGGRPSRGRRKVRTPTWTGETR